MISKKNHTFKKQYWRQSRRGRWKSKKKHFHTVKVFTQPKCSVNDMFRNYNLFRERIISPTTHFRRSSRISPCCACRFVTRRKSSISFRTFGGEIEAWHHWSRQSRYAKSDYSPVKWTIVFLFYTGPCKTRVINNRLVRTRSRSKRIIVSVLYELVEKTFIRN